MFNYRKVHKRALETATFMDTLLEIESPKRNTHLLWEHALGSTVSFVGTYAVLFFGPMILTSTRNTKETIGFKVFTYWIEHPYHQIFLSIIAVLVFNIYTIVKNSQRNIVVVKVMNDNENVILELTNYYFKKYETKTIPITDFDIKFEKKSTIFNNDVKRLIFWDTKNKEVVAKLDPDCWIYEGKTKDLMQLLKKY
jgi:hypothetical protein